MGRVINVITEGTMNKKTSTVLVVLIVLAVGLYVAYQASTSNEQATHLQPAGSSEASNQNPQNGTTIVDYYCENGTIIASYSDNSVVLSLSDNRILNLAQAPSGSGVRYENGTIAFLTKGNNAFLQEDGKTTYDKCVAGTETLTGSTNNFTDGSRLFSFSYPNTFTLSGELGFTADWRQQTTTLGMQLAKVTIPRSYQPQTNFSEGTFTIGAASDPTAVKGCLKGANGGVVSPELISINGNDFTKVTYRDAGAGNFYDTTSYRILRNDQCYAVEYTIHSTNIGNYSPDQGITAFDQAKVQGILEKMAQSFKFL